MTNREELFETLEGAYTEYQVAVLRAKEQVKKEFAARLDELLGDAREELSREMHAAHAAGLSKDRIRRAVKAYNNSSAFDPLWQAYTPDQPVDLRTRKGADSADEDTAINPGVQWAGDDLLLTLSDGLTVVLEQATLEDGEYVQAENLDQFTGDEHLSEIMALAYRALTNRTNDNEEDTK